MKSFFKNVLANIVAIFLVFFAGFFFFVMMMIIGSIGGDNIKVRDKSILTLTQNTNITDSPLESQPDFLFGDNSVSNVIAYDIVEAIKKAKSDDKIQGISIESDFINAGITQLSEVRNALEDFKKSGKFVYAYGNNVSQSSYFLSSVADQYFLNPVGMVELKGLSTEVGYLKDFMDKYGVGVQVLRHGKYKSAVETYMRSSISEENKEQLSTLLNDLWGEMSAKISKSRKMSQNQLNLVADSLYGMLTENNIEHRLVDRLIHKSQYDELLRKKLNLKEKDKLNKISFAKYTESFKEEQSSDEEIAVLYASGAIYNGKGYDGIYADTFIKEIKELKDNEDVKAVVLRINSPGGSANASEEILNELQLLKAKKPLVVSFGDYAASGGYYIAMAGEKIYSEPMTLTGSIGVFGVLFNVKDIANRNGFHTDVVSTNANANYYSIFQGLSPHGEKMMSKSIEQTYSTFVNHVMKNRKMTFEQVDNLGGGRVWSGIRAKENGLVDELGSLNDAIAYASKKAGLKKHSVKSYPAEMSYIEQLMKDFQSEEDLEMKLVKKKLGKDHYMLFKTLTNTSAENRIMMQTPYTIKY